MANGYVPIDYPSWVYFPGEAPRLVQSADEFARLMAQPVPAAMGGVGVAPAAVVVQAQTPQAISVQPNLRVWGKKPIVNFVHANHKDDH